MEEFVFYLSEDTVVDWKNIQNAVSKRIREYKVQNNHQKYKDVDNLEKLIKWEVDRVLKYLNDSESPLSWFENKVSDEILIDLVESWILADFDDRKLLSQLKYPGMRYDYTLLMGEPYSAEEFKHPLEVTRKIKYLKKVYDETEEMWNPITYMKDILDAIISHRGVQYTELICDIRIFNEDVILRRLFQEKEIAYRLQLELAYYKRVTQYIKFTEVIFCELLANIIFTFHRNGVQVRLNEIGEELTSIKQEVMRRKEISSNRSIPEITVNEEGKSTSPAGVIFVLAMQYKAYMEEMEGIEKLLVEDLDEKASKECFYNPQRFSHVKISEYKSDKELLLDLIEKTKKGISSDDYRHLEFAKKYIAFCNRQGESLGNIDDPMILRVVYREIIKNKAKLNRKNDRNALTIAKARMSSKGNAVTNREEIFLECKIQRGIFRENNVLQGYKQYVKICQLYRELMLYFAFLPTDIEMYRYISTVFDDVLDTVNKCVGIEM